MSISSQLSKCTSNQFNIIYADPPWKYSQSVKQGVLKRKNGTLIYPSMSMKELKAIGPDIQRVSKDDAALLLWATMPLLPEAFSLMEAWGFKYKTCFVNWIKTRLQKTATVLRLVSGIIRVQTLSCVYCALRENRFL